LKQNVSEVVARRVLGMAGPGDTLESPWPPLPIRPC
jgi:hypothetical protein